MRTALVGLLALACLGVPTQAKDRVDSDFNMSGSLLSKVCSAKDMKIVCVTYLAGVVDVVIASRGAIRGHQICLPRKPDLESIGDIVIKYIAAHPEYGTAIAASAVDSALAEAYPCSAN